MYWLDHFFIFLLIVAQPINGTWSYRVAVKRIKAGETLTPKTMYQQTMLLQWVAFAVFCSSWFLLGRPWPDLGVEAPSGIGFYIGIALVIAMCVALQLIERKVRGMSSEEKVEQVDALGDTVYFLPRSRPDLVSFRWLSVTAGIVEEVIYRGFALWYLLHFMPLWAAVLVSSVIFGLGHLYQGVTGAVKTASLGLGFALLYVLSGSIWVPIIAHILMDLLQGQVIVELLRPGSDPEPD